MTKTEKGWINDLVNPLELGNLTSTKVRGYGASGQRVFHSYYIAIEDPFEIANNAARTVNYHGFVNVLLLRRLLLCDSNNLVKDQIGDYQSSPNIEGI